MMLWEHEIVGFNEPWAADAYTARGPSGYAASVLAVKATGTVQWWVTHEHYPRAWGTSETPNAAKAAAEAFVAAADLRRALEARAAYKARPTAPATTEQPAPRPNDKPAVWPLVISDMQTRDGVGRARYGTPLQPFNGRDALRDAYEEALDLVVYLRQAIYERDGGVMEPVIESEQ